MERCKYFHSSKDNYRLKVGLLYLGAFTVNPFSDFLFGLLHGFYQLLVTDAQEADLSLDPVKEAGVGSREHLLHNQEASIRERMRHENCIKTNENCSFKYFFLFLCMLFSTLPRVNFEGLVKQIVFNSYWVIRGFKNVVLSLKK